MLNIQIFHQTKAIHTPLFHNSYSKEEEKNKLKGSIKAIWRVLWLAIQKEVISKPKQPSCKKRVQPPKRQDEKRCEIYGGGQEMAVMVG